MNTIIFTPWRTVTTTHPIFYTTNDKTRYILLFMSIGLYFVAARDIPYTDKQMCAFSKCHLPLLKGGRIRFTTFHMPYSSVRTSPMISPASFMACVRVQSIKRGDL